MKGTLLLLRIRNKQHSSAPRGEVLPCRQTLKLKIPCNKVKLHVNSHFQHLVTTIRTWRSSYEGAAKFARRNPGIQSLVEYPEADDKEASQDSIENQVEQTNLRCWERMTQESDNQRLNKV